MKDFQTRHILIYFLTIFGSSAYMMSGTYGWWSLLWALLTVLIFGVGIPAPLFFNRIVVKKKGYANPLPILLWSYLGAFVFLLLVFIPQTGSLWGGIFMGLLYYGYPGTVIAWIAFRFLT